MNFPITYHNNFFKDPNKIVSFAKQVGFEKFKNINNVEITRSKCFSLINPDLFNFISNKLFSIFYDFNLEPVSWQKTGIFFQKNKGEFKERDNNSFRHNDKDSVLSGIIYLNKETNLDLGTTFYDKEDIICKFSSYFNSLLMYDGSIDHTITSNNKDIRLSIICFIDILQSKQTPLTRSERVNLNYDF